MDGNMGKTSMEYGIFCNLLDLSSTSAHGVHGDFNKARHTILAMFNQRDDVNLALTKLFTTLCPTRRNGNSSKRICHGPKQKGNVPCPYLSSLNVKFMDVQQKDQSSWFKANTSKFVRGFLEGDHDNETMWENNSKLVDCQQVGYTSLTVMRNRKFNQDEFDGQCVKPRCPYCHIMIMADDWDKKIRLDETNEYRKLKSLMIDDQECWCAGEGDYKGAGKTECPHTEFFDCELAKCQTPKDKEKLIMGWSVFDHKTPQWLAVSTATAAADAAVVCRYSIHHHTIITKRTKHFKIKQRCK